jgi:hypothetical protein
MIRATFTAIVFALTATVAQAEIYGDWVFHEVKDEMTGENNSYISTYAYGDTDSKYDFTKPQMSIFCSTMQFTDLDILYGGKILIKTDKMSKAKTQRFKENQGSDAVYKTWARNQRGISKFWANHRDHFKNMREGNTMLVRFQSYSRSNQTIRISLTGFSSASYALAKVCR